MAKVVCGLSGGAPIQSFTKAGLGDLGPWGMEAISLDQLRVQEKGGEKLVEGERYIRPQECQGYFKHDGTEAFPCPVCPFSILSEAAWQTAVFSLKKTGNPLFRITRQEADSYRWIFPGETAFFQTTSSPFRDRDESIKVKVLVLEHKTPARKLPVALFKFWYEGITPESILFQSGRIRAKLTFPM